MVDCIQTSASTTMRANSQAFLYNLQTTDFIIKKTTKAFLLDNEGSLFYLETSDVEVSRVLLAQILIDLKKDTILKENLNEILFADFSSFIAMSLEQKEDFQKNFPDLLVCILDNEEQLSKQSHILESWINIIKVNDNKIIFISKNPKHLQEIMINNEMTNIFKLKLDMLWKQNEIPSNNEVICEVENNLVNNESISARALDECTNINLKEEESSGNTSHGKGKAKDANLDSLLQSLGVKELDAVNGDGDTQLHLAAFDGKTEIVESLLNHGAKKDVKNNYSSTALHYATQKGHNAIVHMLLKHGFNVNAANKILWTPLHYACNWYNDAHLIEILLKFGADMERKNKSGRTALHLASCYSQSAVINSLLKNAANINAQDYDGDTPLHKATSNNNLEVILILLQHGAVLNIKNKDQKNALDIAKKYNRTKIIKILENHTIHDVTTK